MASFKAQLLLDVHQLADVLQILQFEVYLIITDLFVFCFLVGSLEGFATSDIRVGDQTLLDMPHEGSDTDCDLLRMLPTVGRL